LTDSATLAVEALLSASAFAAVITALFKLLSDSLQDSRKQSESIWLHINGQIATYYWPLVMAAWGARAYAKRQLEALSDPSDPVLGAFHWYAQIVAIRDEMALKRAWILLPHTDAEASSQDLAIQFLSRPGFSDLERSTLSSKTRLDQSLMETAQQVSTDPVVKPLFNKFSAWMRNPGSVAALGKFFLDADNFCELMASECNLMYSKWYGHDYTFKNYRLRRRVRAYAASEP